MLGAELKRIRGKVSRADFAAELGFHKNTVANHENEDPLPEVDYLAKFAAHTGTEFEHLLKLRLSDSKVEAVRKYAAVKEEKAKYCNKSSSLNVSVDRYNDINDEVNKVFNKAGFSPSVFLQETIKTMLFTNKLTPDGLLILIRALKADYENTDKTKSDQTI